MRPDEHAGRKLLSAGETVSEPIGALWRITGSIAAGRDLGHHDTVAPRGLNVE
jgi:hypothetical protein